MRQTRIPAFNDPASRNEPLPPAEPINWAEAVASSPARNGLGEGPSPDAFDEALSVVRTHATISAAPPLDASEVSAAFAPNQPPADVPRLTAHRGILAAAMRRLRARKPAPDQEPAPFVPPTSRLAASAAYAARRRRQRRALALRLPEEAVQT